MRFRRKVQHGAKLGKKLGFPTLNFRVGDFATHHSPGIYQAWLHLSGKTYLGALYFGPKDASLKPVLELHVLNFSQSIYGQLVQFSVGEKIREPVLITSLDELKKQIAKDVSAIQKITLQEFS